MAADGYFELVCDAGPIRVVVTDAGPRVLEAAKAVRRRTGLSLWHGKALLGRLPAVVLDDVTSDLAEAVAAELRAAGATVEVRY
ncbi:ribosomal protein L7/L12 [Kitasatospora sp. NPDC058048]|uniref:ribosomal protein L7/L12 n=1 Tax=Kitasatospora sp. NPDC058048 TaxID=3346313 RepID=UPI0036D960C2